MECGSRGELDELAFMNADGIIFMICAASS
jgi:hypothetical protein